ncbi:uncharacterized protein [Haliotis cracherodii]|uniref:uncharacterized protein n=1 Tax=Haliotis cracherodii TaxID=6455 RepID=UPI0039E99B9D
MAKQQNCYFNPRTFQLDFEIAAHNAVWSASPSTLIRGCYFHFTQCVWRRVQKEGLATDYKNDDEVRLVRRAAALPLLPLDKVDDVWLQAIADSPAGPKVAAFMDNVTTTWVEGRQFGPEIWNHFGNQGHRTNNNVEGWNHKLNKLTGRAIRTFLKLLRYFKENNPT